MSKIINPAKENKEKLEKFVESNEKTLINLDDIILTEGIHIRARKINLKNMIKKFQDTTVLPSTIIVRPHENKYSLVSGYKNYILAKTLNHNQIQVIIINKSRKYFLKEIGYKHFDVPQYTDTVIKLQDIIIPETLTKTTPKQQKMDSVRSFYKKNKCVDKPITINKHKILTDGYIRYLVLMENDQKYAPVRFKTHNRSQVVAPITE